MSIEVRTYWYGTGSAHFGEYSLCIRTYGIYDLYTTQMSNIVITRICTYVNTIYFAL